MKYSAAVITISDKGYLKERVDESGPKVIGILKKYNYDVIEYLIIPDDKKMIKDTLINLSDNLEIALIITTGGTGFSPKDVTPEATLEVIDKKCDGIAELMRYESLKITPKACLSRAVSGIRKRSLIINLPGSPKACSENLNAVIEPVKHGLDMLYSSGSANCTTSEANPKPSLDNLLKEAKLDKDASCVGIYLSHNGIVRKTAKKEVREGVKADEVIAMNFSYNKELVDRYINETKNMSGVYYLNVWLNSGDLKVGDDIMQILIGADIRPNAMDALNYLISKIKNECVIEEEIYKN